MSRSKKSTEESSRVAAKTQQPARLTSPDPVREGFAPVIDFYQRLKELPFVESIHADRDSDGFEVWVAVNQPDERERELIYDREWEVMDQYRSLGLDVHLVEGDEQAELDLLAGHCFEISLRRPSADANAPRHDLNVERVPIR